MGPLVIKLVFSGMLIVVIAVLFTSLYLVKELSKITKGIKNLASRKYEPMEVKGFFSQITRTLNKMNEEIKASDAVKEKTEQLRREWLANITHDLKTPLSPIKGYAEFLAVCEESEVSEAGAIILRNVNHTEQLINDLKITYQLEAGALHLNLQPVRLERFLREIVIDIVNDPQFAHREIQMECDPKIKIEIDPHLMQRAIKNLIINALTHNPPQTKVIIRAMAYSKGIRILIEDNGTGIEADQLAVIFERYYRGTDTRHRSEGSGLGLAIAKQIITFHNATITVQSNPSTGTVFIIQINTTSKYCCRPNGSLV
jgi:signal transduction histidine kinase